MAQTSVKIDEELVRRVKRHVIDSRQTISEFIEDAVSKKLNVVEKRKIRWIAETSKSNSMGKAL